MKTITALLLLISCSCFGQQKFNIKGDIPYKNYAHLTYAALGGAIKAEPITGNMSNLSGVFALTDQVSRYIVVYLPTAQTITGVKWYQSVQGAYTSSNYNGVALYSLSAGTMTLLVSSTDDGNIWKAAAGWQSKAFSSTIPLTTGVYVVGLLYCRSAETTAPQVGSFANTANSAMQNFDFANSVKLNSTLGARTTLPTSQAMSGTSISSSVPYVGLY